MSADTNYIKAKYGKYIIQFHRAFSTHFDSLTLAYSNQKLSYQEYSAIMDAVFLDTIQKRSKDLADLGVQFDLN